MKLTNAAIIALLLSLSVTFSIASAEMMIYNGRSLTENVMFHGEGLAADGEIVPAGLLSITYQDEDFLAFCVDAEQYVDSGWVSEQGIEFLNNSSYVAYLYETYADSAVTSELAAGLGLALWEVLYEDSDNAFDAASGRLYFTGNDGAVLAANAMLLNMPEDYESVMDLTVLHSSSEQDLLIGGLGSVPEPATLGLLFIGFPLVLKRYRRSARA